ncbi:MAG: CRTAC1 family protein [Gammaproteobacteria bacterium]|nr:CRTAC1 family protein [Gammaproteobacteria bacterium]
MFKPISAFSICLLLAGCGGSSSEPEAPVNQDNNQVETPSEPIEVTLSFTDVTSELNINVFHANRLGSNPSMPSMFSAGVAAEDYDNDGDLDLYLIGGESGQNKLYQNQEDGTFVDVASEAGVAVSDIKGSGPAFADIDGDGHLDLFIGAVDYDDVFVFHNNGDGTFTDVTEETGISFTAGNTVSATFGDVDADGDVDLFVSHWGHELYEGDSLEIVWRNDSTIGDIKFVDISNDMGLTETYSEQIRSENSPNAEPDSSFVPSLSDIDSDGDIDLLLVSDYGLTKVLRNDNGVFTHIESASLIDEFGMGSAVGDIDNDGDMDWYVTSIAEKEYDGEDKNPTEGYRGNTLYLNDGNGMFNNVSASRGVADGGWGWGACMADFNNDSLLDIYHVNGWGQNGQLFAMFQDDESRLFINNGDGTFSDIAADTGVNDAGQGRGLSCNDFDADGDIDIVISNNQGLAKFYRNDLTQGHSFLKIDLVGTAPNTEALGAIVEVDVSNELTLTQEVRLNNNFVSQSANELHFGLGKHTAGINVTVTWPNGETTVREVAAINQKITISQ